MVVGFLFPGQGSQYVGMGKGLSDRFEIARQTFLEAERALGWSVGRLCFEGPEERLNRTEYTQPALLATSIAAWRALGAAAQQGSYVAGHSLGEYSALVAAGALSFSDAIPLVHRRGLFMQEAVPAGRGAMAALLGLSRQQVIDICEIASQRSGKVTAANFNAPDQIVVAGEKRGVEDAAALALEKGAKKAVTLAVSVPSHSPMMKEACGRLSAELEKIDGRDLLIPLINNLEAREIRTWAEAKRGLIDQLSSPLLWEESIHRMRRLGVELFVEIGAGRVLSGLLKRIDRKINVIHVEDGASLDKAVAVLRGEGLKGSI